MTRTLAALPSLLLLGTFLSAGDATNASVSLPRPTAAAPLSPTVLDIATHRKDGRTMSAVEAPRSLR